MDDELPLDDLEALCTDDESVATVSRGRLADGRDFLTLTGTHGAFSATVLKHLTHPENLTVDRGTLDADGQAQAWAMAVDEAERDKGLVSAPDSTGPSPQRRATIATRPATGSEATGSAASTTEGFVDADFEDVGPDSGHAAGEFTDVGPGDDGFVDAEFGPVDAEDGDEDDEWDGEPAPSVTRDGDGGDGDDPAPMGVQ